MTAGTSRAEKMQAIYDQVPPMADCKGNCWISCGPASMTPWERRRLALAGHEVTPDELASKSPWDFWCEALGPDGRCLAYERRPLICRLWGTVDWLPCPWGCRPVGGWLPNETAFRLILEGNRLGGWGRPVDDEAFERLRDPAQVAAVARQLAARGASDMARFREHGGRAACGGHLPPDGGERGFVMGKVQEKIAAALAAEVAPGAENLASETWRAVVGYEGLYEVSDLGRVRSLPRKGGSGRSYGGFVLRPALGSGEYLCVVLSRNNSGVTKGIHQLVAEAFIGPKPEGQVIRHGPGGSLDNRPVNLCYGTHQDNSDDMVRAGRSRFGEKHSLSKLTESQVAEMRSRARSGESQRSLAQAFGTSRGYVSQIVNDRRWRGGGVPKAADAGRPSLRVIRVQARRQEYFQLRASGLSTADACNQIGISRDTGWRYERVARAACLAVTMPGGT